MSVHETGVFGESWEGNDTARQTDSPTTYGIEEALDWLESRANTSFSDVTTSHSPEGQARVRENAAKIRSALERLRRIKATAKEVRIAVAFDHDEGFFVDADGREMLVEDVLAAFESLYDRVDWLEHGVAEWRDVAEKAKAEVEPLKKWVDDDAPTWREVADNLEERLRESMAELERLRRIEAADDPEPPYYEDEAHARQWGGLETALHHAWHKRQEIKAALTDSPKESVDALNLEMAEQNVAIAHEVLPEWDESGDTLSPRAFENDPMNPDNL